MKKILVYLLLLFTVPAIAQVGRSSQAGAYNGTHTILGNLNVAQKATIGGKEIATKAYVDSFSTTNGVAVPATDPHTPTTFKRYDAYTAGTYSHFLDNTATAIVVSSGDLSSGLVQLTYDPALGYWSKVAIPVSIGSSLTHKAYLSKNLFDKATMVVAGYLISIPDGDVAANASWSYAKVPVTPGTTYALNIAGNYTIRFEDITGTKIGTLQTSGLTSIGGLGWVITPVPVGAVSMSFNIKNSGADNINTTQVEVGSDITSYVAYSLAYTATAISSTEIEDAYARTVVASVQTDKVNNSDIGYRPGINLFDKSSMVIENALVSNGGTTIDVAANWWCVKIPITTGTYAIKPMSLAASGVLVLNSFLTTIDHFSVNSLNADISGTGKQLTITDPAAAYLVFNVKSVGFAFDNINTLQVEWGNICTDYVPFQKFIYTLKGAKVTYDEPGDTRYYINKNIAFYGDSITDEDQPNAYTNGLKQLVRYKNYKNYARSGAFFHSQATTAYSLATSFPVRTQDNVIWNQYNRHKYDVDTAHTVAVPDVIVIAAGTNDGTVYGTPATAFTGAVLGSNINTMTDVSLSVRFLVETIRTQWPNVQIIFFTPYQKGLSDQTPVFTMGSTIEDCATRLGVDCFRADKYSGIYGYSENITATFLADKVHLNSTGNPFFARYVLRGLKYSIK